MAIKNYNRKYAWVSEEFDNWLKKQAEFGRQKGIDISPSDVTHKLLNDFILPKNIHIVSDLRIKAMQRKKK